MSFPHEYHQGKEEVYTVQGTQLENLWGGPPDHKAPACAEGGENLVPILTVSKSEEIFSTDLHSRFSKKKKKQAQAHLVQETLFLK